MMQVRCLSSASCDVVKQVWNEAVRLAEEQATPVTARLVSTVHQSFKRKRVASINLSTAQRTIQLQCASVEWYTPPQILALVRQVFTDGTVDLDPCSNSIAQATVQASQYYTSSCASLNRSWYGRVYVNPPFGQVNGKSQQGAFLAKSIIEHTSGRATEVLLLLKAAVGYKWFSQALQYPHALLSSTVDFLSPLSQIPQAWLVPSSTHLISKRANPHGSIVVYLGPNTDSFCSVFSAIAYVPGVNCWSATKAATS